VTETLYISVFYDCANTFTTLFGADFLSFKDPQYIASQVRHFRNYADILDTASALQDCGNSI